MTWWQIGIIVFIVLLFVDEIVTKICKAVTILHGTKKDGDGDG